MKMFEYIAIGGIYLTGAIIAIVTWAKNMGLKDEALRWLSAGLGLSAGLAYQFKNGFPSTPEGWITAIVFALVLAVTPSGLVDTAYSVVKRN